MNVNMQKSLLFPDGHHKLIRWRFVTHAGIDGYTRVIVYMECSNNNRAQTVYSLFLRAVRQFWLPSRVRCDQGGENYSTALHMLRHRGVDRRSVIVGSSVHNQRIERLWRDLHRCVTQLFYRLFYYLEGENLLDPLNEVNLFALHYVYLPRINSAIEHFKQGWNHHPIRTAHNRSPYQLFTSAALNLQQSGLAAVDFFASVDDSYGIEEEGLASDDSGVEVPRIAFSLTDEHYEQLQQNVNPLAESSNFGIELYIQTLGFINTIVTQHPHVYQNQWNVNVSALMVCINFQTAVLFALIICAFTVHIVMLAWHVLFFTLQCIYIPI